jgi:hypothetical protein
VRKHVNDFRRGWELAGLGFDQPVGTLTDADIDAASAVAADALERPQI